MVSFSSLIACGDVLLEIIRHMASADLIRFMRVSRKCRDTIANNKYHLFNIYADLLDYFDDPDEFRALQASTGAIISGSFALQFFSRTARYQYSDLDLYVHTSVKEVFGEWLLKNGYRFYPYSPRRPRHSNVFENTVNSHLMMMAEYRKALEEIARTQEFTVHGYGSGCLGVLDFVAVRGGQNRRVQIIAIDVTPMTAIMGFHSTCVLNFITYDHAFSLYPKATFVHGLNLALKQPSRGIRQCLNKYVSRGFECVRFIDPPRRDWFHLDEVRWVKDRHAWHIELPPLQNLPPSDRYTSPAIITTWSITSFAQDRHELHYYLLLRRPATFPLIFATDHIRVEICDALTMAHDATSEDPDTLRGYDGDMQALVQSMIYLFSGNGHNVPSTRLLD